MAKYKRYDRTEPLVMHKSKITIKDHKENFNTKLTVRIF